MNKVERDLRVLVRACVIKRDAERVKKPSPEDLKIFLEAEAIRRDPERSKQIKKLVKEKLERERNRKEKARARAVENLERIRAEREKAKVSITTTPPRTEPIPLAEIEGSVEPQLPPPEELVKKKIKASKAVEGLKRINLAEMAGAMANAKVNKSPAFQFYPNDWLGSTQIMLMTPAEEGAYVRLLAIAWNSKDCGLPDDDKELAVLSRLGELWFNGSGTTLRKCFTKKGTRLYNQRLLKEREKQEVWREKSRQGGIKSGKVRNNMKLSPEGWLKGGCDLVEPKGNSSSSSLKNKPFVEDSAELRLTTLLLEEIQRNRRELGLSPIKEPNLQAWAKHIDLLIKVDKITPERIESVIKYSQHSYLGRNGNLLSTEKLRKHFEALEQQMAGEKKTKTIERSQVEYKDFTGTGQR